MPEVNITQDLEAVTMQLQTLIAELQELDQKRVQLAQQIQNLNGVAMYLRGKQPVEDQTEEEETEPTPIQEE
jgi:cell division protein FtsB